MRCIGRVVSSRGRALVPLRSVSFVAHALHGKLITDEIIPFPVHGMGEDEMDNVATLTANIRKAVQDGKTPTLAQLKDWGVFGISVPEELGGLGLSHTGHALVAEVFGECFPTLYRDELREHVSQSFAIVNGASSSKEVKSALLSEMSADKIVGWAVTEKKSGEDWSATTTSATLNPENTGYVLDGVKTGVALFRHATHFIVAAKTDVQSTNAEGNAEILKKLSLFLVPRATPGVTVTEDITTRTASVTLKGAVVPLDSVIGNAGEGFTQLLIARHTTHYTHAALVLGLLKKSISFVAATLKAQPHLEGRSCEQHAALADLTVKTYVLETVLGAFTANMDRSVEDHLVEDCIMAGLASSLSAAAPQLIHTALGSAAVDKLASARYFAEVFSSLNVGCVDWLEALSMCCAMEEITIQLRATGVFALSVVRTLRALGFIDRLLKSTPPASLKNQIAEFEKKISAFSASVEKVSFRSGELLKTQPNTIHRLALAASHIHCAAACISRLLSTKTADQSKILDLTQTVVETANFELQKLAHIIVNPGSTSDEMFSKIAADVCAAVHVSSEVKV